MITFVHMSDTHIHTDPAYRGKYGTYPANAGAAALVDHINQLPFNVDFVLHAGDVIYDPDEAAYEMAAQILSALRVPVFYLAGNHDHPAGLQRHLLKRAESEIRLPLHYECDVRGVQVVVLDSNGPAPEPAGRVTGEQLDFLRQVCAADDQRPLIVALHHNIAKVGIPWLDHYMGAVNGDQVHQVLLQAKHRLRGVFTGHIHQNLDVVHDGILYSAAASSWFQFSAYTGLTATARDQAGVPGFSVVTVSDQQTLVRRYSFTVPT